MSFHVWCVAKVIVIIWVQFEQILPIYDIILGQKSIKQTTMVMVMVLLQTICSKEKYTKIQRKKKKKVATYIATRKIRNWDLQDLFFTSCTLRGGNLHLLRFNAAPCFIPAVHRVSFWLRYILRSLIKPG